MGTIIGACGHQLTDEEFAGFKNYVALMGTETNGKPCVDYKTVCNSCIKWYKDMGTILKNQQAIDDYMAGKIKQPK